MRRGVPRYARNDTAPRSSAVKWRSTFGQHGEKRDRADAVREVVLVDDLLEPARDRLEVVARR